LIEDDSRVAFFNNNERQVYETTTTQDSYGVCREFSSRGSSAKFIKL